MKKILFFAAVMLIGAIGFMNSQSINLNKVINSVKKAANSIQESNPHSAKMIEARFTEMLSKGLDIPEDESVRKFFSKEFREVYTKVDEYEREHLPEGEMGFWDQSVWGWGNDIYEVYAIKDVQIITDSTASITVDYKTEDELSTVKYQLVFEDGNWLIDEVTSRSEGFKDYMKVYLAGAEKELEEEEERINAMAERNIYQEKMYIVNGFFNRYIESYGNLQECAEIVKEFCTEAFTKKYLQNIQGANPVDLAVCGRLHRANESFGASVNYANLIEDNEAKIDFISDSDGHEFSWYVTLDPESRLISDIKASEK